MLAETAAAVATAAQDRGAGSADGRTAGADSSSPSSVPPAAHHPVAQRTQGLYPTACHALHSMFPCTSPPSFRPSTRRTLCSAAVPPQSHLQRSCQRPRTLVSPFHQGALALVPDLQQLVRRSRSDEAGVDEARKPDARDVARGGVDSFKVPHRLAGRGEVVSQEAAAAAGGVSMVVQ